MLEIFRSHRKSNIHKENLSNDTQLFYVIFFGITISKKKVRELIVIYRFTQLGDLSLTRLIAYRTVGLVKCNAVNDFGVITC